MDQLKPGQFQFVDEEPAQLSESSDASVLRHGARTLARAGETALGLPGEIVNLGLSGANLAHRGLTGEWSPTIETAKKYVPTTETARKYITEPLEKSVLPEGYLTPKGQYEQLADDFVSDLVSIITPAGALGALGKGAKLAKGAVASAAAVSGLGNIAGWATKKLGASQQAADTVKAGTMLGVSLGGLPRMRDAASKLYDKVENLVPATLEVSTKPLSDVIKPIEKLIAPHASTKGGKALSDYLNDTFKSIANPKGIKKPTFGPAKLKDIIELDKGFNKVVSQNPSIAYDVKKARDMLKDAIETTIQQSGRPEILKSYRSAQTLWREANRASEAQEWVQSLAHSMPTHGHKLSRYTKMLLGVPLAVARGITQSGENIKEALRLFSVPEVRRYWFQAARAAVGKSRPAWIKAANMLDKSVQKNEPQQTLQPGQFQFID
jgi:hypothetical protein